MRQQQVMIKQVDLMTAEAGWDVPQGWVFHSVVPLAAAPAWVLMVATRWIGTDELTDHIQSELAQARKAKP